MGRHLFAVACVVAQVGLGMLAYALFKQYGGVDGGFLMVAGAPLVGLAWYADDLNDRRYAHLKWLRSPD